MAVCTFLGHRECYGLEEATLRQIVVDLIGQGVDTFYVGNQGQFDATVRLVLRQLQKDYPHIRFTLDTHWQLCYPFFELFIFLTTT